MNWHWNSRTHQFITGIALDRCNPAFKRVLNLHRDLLILGIEAPDRLFKDFIYHYHNCTANKYGVNRGKIVEKIIAEIQLIETMLENPTELIHHPKAAEYLKQLLNTPLKSLVFEFGCLTHYIADLHQPLHTDGKDKFAEEEVVHKVMEADTRKRLYELEINIPRRKRIKDPMDYFYKQIYTINELYDPIIENYYLSPGKVKKDRWLNTKPIVEQCITLAGWNIANILLPFEAKISSFAQEIKLAKLINKIPKKLSSRYDYHLVTYSSGTVSIRRKR